MNEINESSLSQKIVEQIENKHIKMRPKWQFVMFSVVALSLGILLSLTIIYLVSFIFFILDYSGVLFIPVFGGRGWYTFLLSMPWFLILLLVILFFILETFITRSRLLYKRPLIYSVLATLGVIFLVSYAITKTSLHERLLSSADKHALPIAGSIYRGYGHKPLKNVHTGIILQVELPNKVYIRKFNDGTTTTILITEKTRLPRGKEFNLGEKIVIFGKIIKDHELEAFGIEKTKVK